MARLVSPPNGLGTTSIQPLSSPRTVGAGSTKSIGGFVQTFAMPFGLWRFQFSYPAMHRSLFRRYRGWAVSLHGGANATRWHFYDPDRMTLEEAGAIDPPSEGMTWSNGMPWSNGENWQVSHPLVAVDANAAREATTIFLADDFWGHGLDVGDYIGFMPLHFGLYCITEVFDEGEYRIWPPLRKAITTDSYATLSPTLAMRLEGEEAATAGRGLVVADSLTVTMIEVLDPDVRRYFTD